MLAPEDTATHESMAFSGCGEQLAARVNKTWMGA